VTGFLLDTCVVSEFRKPLPDAGVQLWLSSIDARVLYLSAVTVGELTYGIETLQDRRKRADLERWLATEVLSDFKGRVLPLDSEAGSDWGAMRAAGRRAGKMVPVVDAMVAAIARRNGLVLVTRNERDFEFVQVPIVNPWQTQAE
jgi:toxin FitB